MHRAGKTSLQGADLDFLACIPDGRQWLVQVCHDLSDPQTLARELRALQDAQQEHPQAHCLLIALLTPAVLDLPPSIELHKAAVWLLGEEGA